MHTVLMDIKIQCAVCQDKVATGRHYGVFSCFGCKSFWRRSIWHNRRYKCKFGGNCPMRRICRNICRACRLQRCYNVGMLPCAVKAERRSLNKKLSKLNITSTNSVKERSPSIVSAKTETSSTDVSPDVLTPVYPKQFLAESPVWYSLINEGLLSESENISTLFEDVCNRVDTQPTVITHSRQNTSVISTSEDAVPPSLYKVVPFSDAFYHPELVGRRSKLELSGLRTASVQDADDCLMRCFLLYADWLNQLPEFMQLSREDQLTLARQRFYVFYWWITAIWTIRAKCNGICYSNGSFLKNKHSTTDSKNAAYLHFNRFIQPLTQLQCSKFELCAVFLMALLNQTNVLNVSPETDKLCTSTCDKLRKAVFVHAYSNSIKNISSPLFGGDQEVFQDLFFKAMARSCKLSQIAGVLLELVEYAFGNSGLCEIYVVNWECFNQ
uniref:Nuclear receptor domain-containing protein n=1 Tax=Panagrellus redivivus TaxID=6233 RepID=A0A7E4V7Y7_PANRE